MARKAKTLVKVWDPKGDMHEVSPLNARDMINHRKWTGHNPSSPAAMKELAFEKYRNSPKGVDVDADPIASQVEEDTTDAQDVIDAAGSSGENEPESVEHETEEVNLSALNTKQELADYADEKFAVVLDMRKSLDKLQDEVDSLEEAVSS